MKTTNQPPLHVQPAVSMYLKTAVVALHAIALAVVVSMPIFVWLKLLLWGAIGLTGWHMWRLHVQRILSESVLAVTYYAPDNWRVYTVGGSHFATLEGSSFVAWWLSVLNLRAQDQRVHTLILLPDALPAETWRDLRVRLQLGY